MPRQRTTRHHRPDRTYQLDLFSHPPGGESAQMPRWQTLPAETRRSLTKLMVRLILDHADCDEAPAREEMRHDV